MTQRAIRVIADDYALSPGVSDGILTLARAGRLSGTGAMTPSPRWVQDAVRLLDTPAGFQTGVHLTLTGRLAPLGAMPHLCPGGCFPSLARWLLLSHTGQLLGPSVQAELQGEIERQLDRFEVAMGRPPHFIDGHQHLHLLPGIRPLLLEAVTRRYPPGSVWLRDCTEPLARIVRRRVATGKALFIAGLARGMARQSALAGFSTNKGFAGIYSFAGDFPILMERFLHGLSDDALIMVHPAVPDVELAALDPVVAARGVEMSYLIGPDWPLALARHGLRLH